MLGVAKVKGGGTIQAIGWIVPAVNRSLLTVNGLLIS